jgi:hypothetical protein
MSEEPAGRRRYDGGLMAAPNKRRGNGRSMLRPYKIRSNIKVSFSEAGV